MTRVYFAGVNQSHFCEAFAGLDVLESFADIRPVMDRYRPTFASMVLDCGAYTELTSGKPIDLGSYSDFCLEHGAGYEWVASLDSIGGGPAANVANWQAMLARGVHGAMPTFHQGEPLELLRDYCRETKRIGLGFQRPIKSAREWLASCFAVIPPGVQVHGWAMTAYTDLPFASVDSTTWLWEMKALQGAHGQGAEALRCLTTGELIAIVQKKYQRQAKRARWEGKPQQADLFAETA